MCQVALSWHPGVADCSLAHPWFPSKGWEMLPMPMQVLGWVFGVSVLGGSRVPAACAPSEGVSLVLCRGCDIQHQ